MNILVHMILSMENYKMINVYWASWEALWLMSCNVKVELVASQGKKKGPTELPLNIQTDTHTHCFQTLDLLPSNHRLERH